MERNILAGHKIFCSASHKICFLEETWGNRGPMTSEGWTDTAVKSKKQAFLLDLSTGLKEPSCKCKKLVTVHTGSELGSVDRH
jgi:hypothetical protein